MKKIFFLTTLFLCGLYGTAQAQTARQLYLGYESNSVLASAPQGKSAEKNNSRKKGKKGKPGTKVVIERMRDGKLSFVSPSSRFQSGDKIRLRFETNFDGYVKILNVGSSGNINLLFPYDGADDRIRPTKDFQVPKNGDWIVFDNTPGIEILTVVMSKEPFESDDQKNLHSLNEEAAAAGRDLNIQSDDAATYVVAEEAKLQKPIGFTLRLRHQ